jgi:polyisoprenyl-phosphate glycosyltransferase
MSLLSIVVPVYNEQENVGPFYERMAKVLDATGCDWEIIFAEDPSTDATKERILALRDDDPRVKLMRFSRRFGQPAATLAGMAASRGDAVVVIDVDLQDPPELIGDMVDRWREGFDVVYAQRRTREGETLAKRVVSAAGYRLIRRIGEVEIPENTGDFRLMSRRVVDEVVALNEAHGFLRGLVALVGFNQTAVVYDRDARAAGDSKYNKFLGSLTIGLNGIISFSRYPLQVISLGGMFLSALAFLLAFSYLIAKIVGVGFPTGNPTIVILISLFSGIQLLSLGIMGEYVGRIYDEVKRRPKFILDSAYGIDAHPPHQPAVDVAQSYGIDAE